MNELDSKIIEYFPGKYVKKDLTAQIKRDANVPTYVLEYLLGQYCSTDNEESVQKGLSKIRRILAQNYVRADDSEKIKSRIRERGKYTVIDMISVRLDEREDTYVANFKNLEISALEIDSQFVIDNDKLLEGGVWCIVKLEYDYGDEVDDDSVEYEEKPLKNRSRKYLSPFIIADVKPIQMPNLDLAEMRDVRNNFSDEEWIYLLLRSEGYEPSMLTPVQRKHFLLRLVPLIQKNYNLVELGPRGTGKSHVYQELSPHSILISGGQTTVANLFYNMNTRKVGLVGHWDCIAFDEVSGMSFRDIEAINILKNYMANGALARGQSAVNADASLCFEGNINDSVQNMLKTAHLFSPFPDKFNDDSAFFDRIHYYLPGWETPKLKTELLTTNYGLITDCLSEYCREMRRYDFTNLFDDYFELNNQFNKRDDIAVRKTFSGLAKLMYPNLLSADESISKEQARELLEYSIEGRRRVKEQLYKMAGVEFLDRNLGYIDKETGEETIVQVSEQLSRTLIPENELSQGHVFAVGKAVANGSVAVYRLENKYVRGTGKIETQGIPSHAKSTRECINAAFTYFKENAKHVVPGAKFLDKDWLLYYADPQDKGVSDEISLAEFIGLCSALADRPISNSTVIVGEIKISGSMMPVTSVSDIVRVSIHAGAKRIFLPTDAMQEYMQISKELRKKINATFYEDPIDAAQKALNIY